MAKIGDDTRTSFTFTLLGTETPADPDEIYVLVRLPDLTVQQYEFGVDSEITKLGVGSYQFSYRPLTMWNHVIQPIGIGNVNKLHEVLIEVDEPYLSDPIP